jgi:hypothetical protein
MAHPSKPYTRWTDAQVATLREQVHAVSMERLARLCAHSVAATQAKLRRLGITSAVVGDDYTIKDLRQCLRVSDHTVRRWIDAGWLVGKKGSKDWRILPAAVADFILAHPLEVASGTPDVAWLLAMVAPAVQHQRMSPAATRAALQVRRVPLVEDDLRY